MLSYEEKLKGKGYERICGVDEAGRGPLAGPVVAAAVIISDQNFLAEITDSKKLSPKKREQAYEEILRTCEVGIGIASVQEIDELNILGATFLGMKRAVNNLSQKADYVLVDGSLAIPELAIPQEAIIKGDSLSLSIAASSIVAKVKRDQIMVEYHSLYPEYNFSKHKGYPTKEHRLLLKKHGPSPIHRKSFNWG